MRPLFNSLTEEEKLAFVLERRQKRTLKSKAQVSALTSCAAANCFTIPVTKALQLPLIDAKVKK